MELLERLYRHFNARGIDEGLQHFSPDVEWPNTIDGGTLRGHDEIRACWAAQFEQADPQVTPTGFDEEGATVVHVHQIENGNVLREADVDHLDRVTADGKVASMRVRDPG